MTWTGVSTTERPVVGLSKYVIEKMPIQLATTGIDMAEVNAIGLEVNDHITGPLARLDAKMLEIAIIKSGMNAPDWLTKLVEKLSDDRPRGILYEEIVLANPEKEMRTFTTGNESGTEKSFYYAHVLIEDALDSALKKLRKDAETLDPDKIEAELNLVMASTGMLAQMQAGHFDTFRTYLNSHPKRGTKGPSGLFSPGMAELQLRSGFVPSGFIDFLHTNLVYYPVQSWPKLQRALHEFDGITASTQKNTDLTKALRVFWQRWRKVHLATTIYQVPEITKGTGGETDPITFLKNRMKNPKDSEDSE
jgi:hypothetical protein